MPKRPAPQAALATSVYPYSLGGSWAVMFPPEANSPLVEDCVYGLGRVLRGAVVPCRVPGQERLAHLPGVVGIEHVVSEAAGPTASCHSASASAADPVTPAPTTTSVQHRSMSHAYQ
jgi:hypothetical protein